MLQLMLNLLLLWEKTKLIFLRDTVTSTISGLYTQFIGVYPRIKSPAVFWGGIFLEWEGTQHFSGVLQLKLELGFVSVNPTSSHPKRGINRHV